MTRREELPGRMDRLEAQILDLRSEVREQISQAVVHTDTRFDEAMSAMRVLHEQGMIHSRTLHAEAMSQGRALYEDLVDRLKHLKG